jgi:hypothetical protein
MIEATSDLPPAAAPVESAPGSIGLRGFGRQRPIAEQLEKLPPALAALLTQVVATAAALALYCTADAAALDAPWTFWALLQAAIAVLLASATSQPQWWIAMHSLFAPAALLLDRMGLPSWTYLGGAALLALTNTNALRERVPLFLTSSSARDRLLELLPANEPIRFLDVGCGFGGVVSSVGREHPTRDCLGLETAWLPWAVSRLRCIGSPNRVRVLRRDLWTHDLAQTDVLYAYLSPVPMDRLWIKATREMRPGAMFISNSFPVPGEEAQVALPIDDATGSVLYLYRIPAAVNAESSEARS